MAISSGSTHEKSLQGLPWRLFAGGTQQTITGGGLDKVSYAAAYVLN